VRAVPTRGCSGSRRTSSIASGDGRRGRDTGGLAGGQIKQCGHHGRRGGARRTRRLVGWPTLATQSALPWAADAARKPLPAPGFRLGKLPGGRGGQGGQGKWGGGPHRPTPWL